MIRACYIIALFVLATTFCCSNLSAVEPSTPTLPVVLNAVPAPQLSQQFQRTNGWTGGDGAYSIPLSKTKTLWLFGDSWIGSINNGKRENAVMINNAAAWQSLEAQSSPMQFFWKTDKGKPKTLIPCPVKAQYYWPMDGALINNRLYIFVRRIRSLPKQTGPFAFEVAGIELLRITNPNDPPPTWQITHLPASNDVAKFEFGAACLTDDLYLYAYGSAPHKDNSGTIHNLCVARIPLDQIENQSRWQYFTQTGWSGTPTNSHILLPDIASEFAVKKVPGLPGYFATWVDFKTRKIMLSQSPSPSGPWLKPQPVYTCPEPPDQFVYSAKHHPELTTAPGEMMLTYCRNVQTLKEHMEKPNVYAPVAVLVKLQSTSESAKNEQ